MGEVFGPFGGGGGHPFVSSHPGVKMLFSQGRESVFSPDLLTRIPLL